MLVKAAGGEPNEVLSVSVVGVPEDVAVAGAPKEAVVGVPEEVAVVGAPKEAVVRVAKELAGVGALNIQLESKLVPENLLQRFLG